MVRAFRDMAHSKLEYAAESAPPASLASIDMDGLFGAMKHGGQLRIVGECARSPVGPDRRQDLIQQNTAVQFEALDACSGGRDEIQAGDDIRRTFDPLEMRLIDQLHFE